MILRLSLAVVGFHIYRLNREGGGHTAVDGEGGDLIRAQRLKLARLGQIIDGVGQLGDEGSVQLKHLVTAFALRIVVGLAGSVAVRLGKGAADQQAGGGSVGLYGLYAGGGLGQTIGFGGVCHVHLPHGGIFQCTGERLDERGIQRKFAVLCPAPVPIAVADQLHGTAVLTPAQSDRVVG